MSWSILLILGAIICSFIGLYFLLANKLDAMSKAQREDSGTRMLNDNIQAMNNRLNDRLTDAARYIGELKKELGAFQSIGSNIEELKKTLTSAKSRGNFGERVLQDLLENNFAKELFALQYKFKTGDTVDAIIKTPDGIIPIDSKFPLENYLRMLAKKPEERADELNQFKKDVKKHIGDIARKYIRQDEGTTSFAVMYVPSEGVFYEIISNDDDLTEHAKSANVIMASPNTFSYVLYILRLGLERIRIEENVKKVWSLLAGLGQESAKFGESLSVLSRHVTNAKNAVDSTMGEYERLSGKIDQIRQLK